MRVTNSMISNSASAHITNAKNSLLKYSEQYTTQKKIQRPSDDPTVAVRSLKLRTTYSQLTQYAEKNVKDAMSWMNTTETALSNISKKFSDPFIHGKEEQSKFCVLYFHHNRQKIPLQT